MVLMVFLSSRISPRTATVILRERSPFATAVVTSAMLRTWPVRLPAMEFTLSVKSFQVPATPRTSAWPPSIPSVPTSRATRVHRDLAREIAIGHGGGHFGDVAHLSRQVAGHGVDAVRKVFPHAADTLDNGLTAQLAFGTHLARHACDFGCEGIQLRHHRVH